MKTKYQTDKTELEKKIPDMSNLVGKAKLTELEIKIPSVSNLVKKQTITQKLLRLKRNLLIMIMTYHITTLKFNTLAADVFNARY